MATKFLEPGGDATFNVATTTAGGLWDTVTGSPVVATDFVHGTHVKSVKYIVNSTNSVQASSGSAADAGTRISAYFYFNALPTSSTATIFQCSGGGFAVFTIRITSGGTLQIWSGTGTTPVQIGTNGATLSTGQWYRISLSYTITTSTVNRFELFVNGLSSISLTNGVLGTTGTNFLVIGNISGDATLDMRSSDHYTDNSNSLTDPGDIWVTAKRPNANGTTNNFTTQIGAGGSGYGTGHSPQVNERALSTTNGWSMVGAGSAVTEEYSIESTATGDIDISTATIVDYVGWAYMSSLAGETVQFILGGANTATAITSTNTMYLVIKGSVTYPTGSTDIGITTATTATTVSLFECGVVVAYIPSAIVNDLVLVQNPFVDGVKIR